MPRKPSFPPHHLLFVLPSQQLTETTVPVIQELPVQQDVTGDKELDALLWLHAVIDTGQPGPIATALEAAKRINTPLKVLAKRYADHLAKTTGNSLAAAFASFGLDDLEGQAKKALEKAQRRTEAEARFPGDTIWRDTEAEVFCVHALRRLKGAKSTIGQDSAKVAERFKNHPEQLPGTLDACLLELRYWNRLYWLRQSLGGGDGAPEATAREWFVMELLAEIPPRSYEESARVLDWMEERAEAFSGDEERVIFKNLLGHPGSESSQVQGRAVEYQCACGDVYPGSSFGAGYMAANNGVCENCDVTEARRG
ncbi:hypothetical protein [Pseudomonas nitroreducens]|uniref:hypothetical protein n=1 Tax=Pseudomonas nitroreducens TaxID=46680 RepID=UPI002D80FD70|nr:hypothetical protein [Pseudomonas nitroreducens]